MSDADRRIVLESIVHAMHAFIDGVLADDDAAARKQHWTDAMSFLDAAKRIIGRNLP